MSESPKSGSCDSRESSSAGEASRPITAGDESETLPPPPERVGAEVPPLTSGESRFDMIRQIARGGEGEIWEAEQLSLGRIVALKVIRRGDDDVSPQGSEVLAESRHHLRRLGFEARLTASLEHPNIVPVYDLASGPDGKPLIAMKRVQGESWAALLAADWKALSPEDYIDKHLAILADVAQAVAFAHSRGIVHRDIKPSQVMIGEFGEVLLMDWGLAVSMDAALLDERWKPRQSPLPATIAHARNPSGTPAFMAPEQTLETVAEIGPWTDVYLLGASLYYLLSGMPPHPGSTNQDIMWWAASNKYAPLSEAAAGRPLPDGLENLLVDAMDSNGPSRPTAGEFLGRLHDIRSGHPRRRRSTAIVEEVESRIGAKADYRSYSELHQKLQEARILWPSNPRLAAVHDRLAAEHADGALASGDFGLAAMLAESVLESGRRTSLVSRAERALVRRRRRERQRRAAFAAVVVLMVVSSVAALVAFRQKGRADRQLGETERAMELARSNAEDAVSARSRAELEQTYASIGIADAYFRDSRPDLAYTTLVDRVPVHMREWEWGALVARLATDEMTLTTGEVDAGSAAFHADWSADGTLIATGHHGGRISVWDARTGARLSTWKFEGFKGFWCVRFDASAERIAATSTNGKMVVVDARTGTTICTATMPGSSDQRVMRGCDLSPDGHLLATTGEDRMVHFWNAGTGDLVGSALLPDSTYDVRFSPDGRTVVVGVLNDEGQARLVAVDSATTIRTFGGHGRSVLSVRFDRTGDRVLTACNDGSVRIFDVETGEERAKFTVPEARMRCAEFGADGKLVAASGNDGTCRVWDVETGALLHRINSAKQMEKVAFDPLHERVLTVSFDQIHLWDLRRLGTAALVDPADASGRDADAEHMRLPSFPYGRKDVWVGYDNFYLEGTGRRVFEKDGRRFLVDSFYSVCSPDGMWRVAIDPEDASARAFVGQTRDEAASGVLARQLYTAAFSDDGKLVAFGARSGDLTVLEAGTWREILRWIHPDESRLAISALRFSPDGSTLAIGWLSGAAATVGLRGKAPIVDLPEAHRRGKPVVCISFSKDGRRFVSASSDETARVWDASTGKAICTLSGHALNVLSAEFSPDGRRVLTASMDNKGKIWDAETGREILNVIALPPDESMMAGAFSRDGSCAFFATSEGHLHVVDCLPWREESWDCGNGADFLACLELHKRRSHFNPAATMAEIAWQ